MKNSGSAFPAAAFSKWGYNDRNELIDSGRYLGTDVTQTTSPVGDEYRAYSFDPIGNRLTSTEGQEAAKSYQANLLNEYTSVGGAALTYDADGNLTSDGARRFSYDAENRLVLVEPVSPSDGSVRVRMAYDYLGRRVQKVVEEFDGSAWAAQDDVRFVYLGWNVIEERRTSGGVSTKKNFVWGLDLSQSIDGAGGIGGLLAVVDEQGSQMAFLYDANGNVGQLVDEQGAVVARYEYDAFGNVLVAEGAAAEENAWRFSTKMADAETGLVYYGYRFYDAALGRWTQRDPIGEDGGLNLHAFVANQVIDRADPLGLDAWAYIEDKEALEVLHHARYAAKLMGYWLTDKLLTNYLAGDGDLTLDDDDMKLILRDRYFHDALKDVVGDVIRREGAGKIEGAQSDAKSHTFDKYLSTHLWSAFNSMRYYVYLEGEVCGVAHGASLRFTGDVEVNVSENWGFSNPANDHRRPFDQFKNWFPWPLTRYAEFEEGRFRRLELRGWVKPFVAEGTFKSKSWALVGVGQPAQSLLSMDRLTGIDLSGL